MQHHRGKSGVLIEEVVGCGFFQVIFFVFLVVLVKITCAYTFFFMSFGSYNPGWKCLETTTACVSGTSNKTNNASEYQYDSCESYRSCKEVEFNTDSSTVITEWGLLCDSKWKSSVVIFIQMFGTFWGSLLGGHLANVFGRKKTLYGSVAFGGVLQLSSSICNNLIVFAILRLFLGACAVSNLVVVHLYMAEMMNIKWRRMAVVFPTWALGTIALALSAYITRNWRTVELVGFVFYAVAFLSICWVPESLRWLELNGKKDEFTATGMMMTKLNGGVYRELGGPDVWEYYPPEDQEKVTIKDIFREGYRFIGFSLGCLFFTYSLIYYALSFGVHAFYGDFYINLILMVVLEVPCNLFAVLLLGHLSRRMSSVIFLSTFSICCFGSATSLVVPFETFRNVGTVVFMAIAKGSINAAWYCLYARTTELYPSVFRGISLGFASSMVRIGGMFSPFFMPERSMMFAYVIGLGIISVICCILNILLPETKGKQIKETFEESLSL